MVPFRFALLLVVFSIAASGCYHATVVTGRTPGAVVYDEQFSTSWVNGLVPPDTVATANMCPNGVAIVETELTFVNQLLGAITFGIYSPMRIKVTCAVEESTSAEPLEPGAVGVEHASVVEASEAVLN